MKKEDHGEGTVNDTLLEGVVLMTKAVGRIEQKVDQTNEAITGNVGLGHKGLAQRMKEQEDVTLTFKQEFEAFKNGQAKRYGYATGVGAAIVIGGKWILFKIGILL